MSLDPLVVAVTVVSWSAAALVLRAAWPLRGVCAIRRPEPAAERVGASMADDRAAAPSPDRT